MAQPKLKPTPDDDYPTKTSFQQAETESALQTHLKPGTPTLEKNLHLQFLVRDFVQGFPVRYSSQDASQP